MNKIVEMFLDSGDDRDANRVNMLQKRLADLQLKKSQIKKKWKTDTARVDSQIEQVRSQLNKL